MCSFRGWQGHPVPGDQQLQAQPENTATLLHPRVGLAPRGTWRGSGSWRKARTGTENARPLPPVNTTLLLPDPAPAQASGEAWLWLVLRPHADVSSSLSSTWTRSALGWSCCQNPVRAAGWRAATADPALLASRAFQVPRSAEGRLRPGDLTAAAEGTSLRKRTGGSSAYGPRRSCLRGRWRGVVPWVTCTLSKAGRARVLTTTTRHRNCPTLGLDGQHGYEASVPALHQTSCLAKMTCPRLVLPSPTLGWSGVSVFTAWLSL